MDVKTDALVLRAADHGENDKLVTLLTAERGKITVAMRGVRKAGAKLPFAAQPFCFAEYVCAEKGGRYTVTSASLYDGFYSLRESVEKFYAAAAVAEACDKLAPEGEACGGLFLAAVRALEEIEGGDPSGSLVKFLLGALDEAGYSIGAGDCPVCGKPLSGRMRFSFQSGAFTCADCSDGAPASEVTYRAVRAARGEGSAEPDGNTRALRLIRSYFAFETESELKALAEYLALGG